MKTTSRIVLALVLACLAPPLIADWKDLDFDPKQPALYFGRVISPGAFTAFIGFEWSSMPSGNNLHRVVVFRDGVERAKQGLPMSAFDSENPEDLWKNKGHARTSVGVQTVTSKSPSRFWWAVSADGVTT